MRQNNEKVLAFLVINRAILDVLEFDKLPTTYRMTDEEIRSLPDFLEYVSETHDFKMLAKLHGIENIPDFLEDAKRKIAEYFE